MTTKEIQKIINDNKNDIAFLIGNGINNYNINILKKEYSEDELKDPFYKEYKIEPDQNGYDQKNPNWKELLKHIDSEHELNILSSSNSIPDGISYTEIFDLFKYSFTGIQIDNAT